MSGSSLSAKVSSSTLLDSSGPESTWNGDEEDLWSVIQGRIRKDVSGHLFTLKLFNVASSQRTVNQQKSLNYEHNPHNIIKTLSLTTEGRKFLIRDPSIWYICGRLRFQFVQWELYWLWRKSSRSPPVHWWPCGVCLRGRAVSEWRGPLREVNPTQGSGTRTTKTTTTRTPRGSQWGSCHGDCGRKQWPAPCSAQKETDNKEVNNMSYSTDVERQARLFIHSQISSATSGHFTNV